MLAQPLNRNSRRGRWSNLSIRAKALALITLPVVALVVSTVLLYRLEGARTSAGESVKNASEIRSQLQTLYIVLISAESEIRNYGLNGREEGLQPFGMVPASCDAIFSKMSELVHDNPEQQARITRLKRLVHERLEGLKQVRAYYQSQGRGAQPPPELMAQARISPDALIALSEIGSKQAKAQEARAKSDEARENRLIWAGAATGVLGALGAIISALMFAGVFSRRIRHIRETALRLHEGCAAVSAPTETDELGQLALAIHSACEKVAAQSEELKLALEGAGVLIWEFKPTIGRIRYQAGAGALQNDRVPAELLPGTVNEWIAVVHPDDRDGVRKELNKIAVEGGSFQIEYRVVIRGGEIRWMGVKAQSHSVAGQTPERLLGVLADITPQKLIAQQIERQADELNTSRQALEHQTRILQSILDSMGDGVIVVDNAGKFLLFNPAARQVFRGDSFEGTAARWAQHYGLFLPDTVTLYRTDQLPLTRAIRGESVDADEIFVRPAGVDSGTWVSVTARPLRQEDGEIKGGVLVIRDITAAKHAAAALEIAKKEAEDANHAKSEFLSRMSHELRTPLNSILGFAQLLEMEVDGDQPSDNIRQILRGGYHLLDLINEILDLARIESGRISLSPEPVRLDEALGEAIDLVRPLAIQQNVNINADSALNCGRHVRADRQRLKQVLLNLLSNAIKFNRKGGSVLISCEATPRGTVRLEMVDTGSGMSSEGLSKIFKPFERLGADDTGVGGTGLGLALTKRLIEAMEGTIGVESAVGLGSRFFLEFRSTDDPSTSLQTHDISAVLASARPRSQRGTILYIEDNPANLNLIERILSHCPGVSLLSAMHGQIGLDLAQFHQPDWILLDVHLPDIPGDEVLRRLRLDARTRHIPVTVLSADATAGQISRLIDAGARDYLTKPLDVRQLMKLLEKTLPNAGVSPSDPPLQAYAERNHTN